MSFCADLYSRWAHLVKMMTFGWKIIFSANLISFAMRTLLVLSSPLNQELSWVKILANSRMRSIRLALSCNILSEAIFSRQLLRDQCVRVGRIKVIADPAVNSDPNNPRTSSWRVSASRRSCNARRYFAFADIYGDPAKYHDGPSIVLWVPRKGPTRLAVHTKRIPDMDT